MTASVQHADDRAKKPVKVGDKIEIRITEQSKRQKDGVARVQGLVIFVPKTKIGDLVECRIIEVGPNHATGKLVKVLERFDDEEELAK